MKLKSIADQLHEYIEAVKEDINRDGFATLIFKVKDGKVLRYEKIHSVNLDEIESSISN